MHFHQANLSFTTKALKSLAPLPFMGPKTWLLVSSSASNSFLRNAAAKAKSCGASIHSLKEGPPSVGSGDICVLVTPSTKSDYLIAQNVAAGGDAAALVIVNGFAKVCSYSGFKCDMVLKMHTTRDYMIADLFGFISIIPKDAKSISEKATMAYFLKPLTYNSQVAGYLIRQYPGKWTTIDATSKEVLGTLNDCEILVRGTNTPDLRPSGRSVQKSVDDRAIRARSK